MTNEELIEKLAHVENVLSVLHDDTIADPVITVARQALSGGGALAELEESLTEEQSLQEALKRAKETLARSRTPGDPDKMAKAHFSVGVCYLALSQGEEALESFLTCSELAETAGDRNTEAWGLAYHGLTKMALFEHLREEGQRELKTASQIFEEEDNMLGVSAIHERLRRMNF